MRFPLDAPPRAPLGPAPGPAGVDPRPAPDLDAATIPGLADRMAAGTLTSVELTRAYLDRIATVDRQVRSVLVVDPTALEQAARSDRRHALGRALGPMDGIPVLIKDNIDTRDLGATAGSRALLVPPVDDAELVGRLRAAGAVVLGKTNMSEWGNFRSAWSTSGWSGVGGQTHNPHVLDRNPCGSSSGSGAAVAASLAQVAVGTETCGSVVSPAGHSGVVGVKPTLGRISGDGIVPISTRQDTAGPLARHVVDAAILLSVLEGRGVDYTAALAGDALRGARIGVWRRAGRDAEVDRVVESAVGVLRRGGAAVVEVDLPHQDRIAQAALPALLTEFKHDLETYLGTRPGAPRTLRELIGFNQADPVELGRFGQDLLFEAEKAPPITDPVYLDQRRTATDLARRSIDEVLAAHRLDAVMAPTNGPAWRTDYAGDPVGLGTATPAAVSGYPNATVPAGFSGPLPIGVSFMAGHGADAAVLRFAAAFERAAPVRRAPAYLPTLP
ncbi:amidase family protein [Saccharothrix algeriensis]|uniref:Amidase n=1 Tax=Saccharothrix algeriensis TaxID=173560 RepID=A0A8T8HY26_9PSEU|nr:amidase family protein [Saccharothrix algeriensis]MBM7814841.1 amidase [Saccharothrix algeriensis]QTR03120.1 amidase [Saccharothrix algeriensis]